MMTSILSLSLLALQATSAASTAVQAPKAPSVRASVPTLEGAFGSAVVGLFDLRSGDFVPERLAPAFADWSHLTPVPLDFSGRTQITAGLAGSPRLRADVGAGSRIELPNGHGTLLQLRGVRAGAQRFALVHVDGAGTPRVVIDAAAAPGGGSPFLSKVGIDPEGRGALIATVQAAGGDLFDADLEAQTLELRTAELPPLAFGIDGIWLGESWGFGVSPLGPIRFIRRPQFQGEGVRVQGAAPAVWRGDAAVSPGCEGGVAVAGTAPSLWTPFVFGPSGPARAASTTSANLSRPGYAPESTFGPFLALCEDGLTAAWRVESGAGPTAFRDVFLGRATATPVAGAASGDNQIVDTVNEVGRILPAPAGGILFAVGEENDPTEGGLEGAEVLRASLSPSGQVALENVSRTSGDQTLPLFDSSIPTLTPAVLTLVSPTVAVLHDDEAKTLVALDLVHSTRTTVLTDVREVYWMEAAGADGAPGSWIAAIERDDSQRRQQIVGAASAQAQATVIDAGTATVEYRSPAAWRAGGGAVAYLRRDAGVEFLDVVARGSLARTRWSTSPSTFSPPIVFAGSRSIAFTRQAGPAAAEQRIWAFRGPPRDQAFAAPMRSAILLR